MKLSRLLTLRIVGASLAMLAFGFLFAGDAVLHRFGIPIRLGNSLFLVVIAIPSLLWLLAFKNAVAKDRDSRNPSRKE
jgi:hypothetical protein